MAAPSNVFANRYEIVREVARGGMADVYLARDTKLDRPVALKVLSAELSRDPAFVERFRLEAQAAANLNHPNIVSIYDWGQEHGTSFIVMEFVDGRTLRDIIRSEGAIAPAQVADLGAETAAALAFAHKNSLVHRDVKPGNVLITPAGQVKVADFGIARADGAAGGLTRTGAVMGTAVYFSPEQAQGQPCDGRSDVYSLGVVLYEMATGVAPFTGDSPVAVAYKQVREAPIPPSQRAPGIPPELERIILTCLAKDPLDRYQSADDLRADLLRFRRGQAIVGAPVTAQVASMADATATMVATPVAATTARTSAAARPPRGKGPLVAVIVLLVVLIGAIAFLLADQLGGGGSGGGSVTVANVEGQPVAAAKAALEDQGLTVEVIKVPNLDVPKGTVIRQNPGAGTKVNKGETVQLTVSDGAGTVKVPDVEGDTFEDAKTALEAVGLTAKQQDEPSDTIALGKVIRTVPAPNAKVEKGTEVVVFVSTGPAPAPVPDVIGVDQVAATQTLVNAGFVVQKSTAPSSSVAAGAVISTTPAAGTPAPRGSTVKMVVSTGPEQVTVPNVIGKTQSAATTTLTGLDFNVTVVQVPSSVANNGMVIAQSPSGGSTATKGTSVQITVGTGPPPTTTTT